MPRTAFWRTRNNVPPPGRPDLVTTSGYTAGSGSMPLATSEAVALFGSPTPTDPVLFSTYLADGTPKGSYTATGVSGLSLTGLVLRSGTDASLPAGSLVQAPLTREQIEQIQDALGDVEELAESLDDEVDDAVSVLDAHTAALGVHDAAIDALAGRVGVVETALPLKLGYTNPVPGHTFYELQHPRDTNKGPFGLSMFSHPFDGVLDPVLFVGYNVGATADDYIEPADPCSAFWAIESHFNNLAEGGVQLMEMYPSFVVDDKEWRPLFMRADRDGTTIEEIANACTLVGATVNVTVYDGDDGAPIVSASKMGVKLFAGPSAAGPYLWLTGGEGQPATIRLTADETREASLELGTSGEFAITAAGEMKIAMLGGGWVGRQTRRVDFLTAATGLVGFQVADYDHGRLGYVALVGGTNELMIVGGDGLISSMSIGPAALAGTGARLDFTSSAVTLNDGNLTVTGTISGNGSGLTNLPAAQLTGTVPSSALPPLAITDTFVVASQAAMLALTAQVGDVAVRTDTNESYILQADPASTLGNWVLLRSPGSGVTSVGLSLPGVIFDAIVSGSPVTGSGTLVPTLKVQIANRVLAGPTTGADATPTFRALVAADIPTIAQSQVTNLATDLAAKSPLAGSTSIITLGTVTTGTWNGTAIGVVYGGTGLATIAANRIPYASALNTFSTSPNLTFDGTTLLASGLKVATASNNALRIADASDSITLQVVTSATAANRTTNFVGNVVLSQSVLATGATSGFTNLPSCAGTPTGTPLAFSGTIPCVVDSTNSKLYLYIGGAWKSVTLT